MHYRNEIHNTIWLAIFQALNYLIPLLLWPYLMKMLGAEQFGFFSFGFSMAQYLIILVDFGFNLSATKEIALAHDDQQQINRIFTSTLCAKLILLGLSLLILLVVGFIPAYSAYREVMLVMYIMTIGCTFFFVWLFQGLGDIKVVSIINGVMKLAVLPLIFWLVRSPEDMLLAALLQSMSYLLTAVLVVIVIRQRRYASLCRIRLKDIYESFRQSLPLFLSTAASSVYTMLFVVIMAYYVSPEEVGRYSASDKLVRCLTVMLWVPLCQAFFPKVSAIGKDDIDKGRDIVKKIMWMVCVGSLLLGAMIYFAAEPLCELLGKGYAGMGELTHLMALLPLLISSGGVLGQLGIIGLGDETSKLSYRNIYLVAAVLSLCLVFPLTIRMSAVGTAIAMVVTEGFVAVAMVVLYRKTMKRLQMA